MPVLNKAQKPFSAQEITSFVYLDATVLRCIFHSFKGGKDRLKGSWRADEDHQCRAELESLQRELERPLYEAVKIKSKHSGYPQILYSAMLAKNCSHRIELSKQKGYMFCRWCSWKGGTTETL